MRLTKSKVNGLALNLTDTCDQCLYCWNVQLNNRFHPEYNEEVIVDRDNVSLLDQLGRKNLPSPVPREECQFWHERRQDILLGAKAEFFHDACPDTLLGQSIAMLNNFGLGDRVAILTKNPSNADMFLHRVGATYDNGCIHEEAIVGTTITTLYEEQRALLEEGADPINLRLGFLHKANWLGYKTWAVVEPFFTGMDLPYLVKLIPFVSELYVGRYNGPRVLCPECQHAITEGDYCEECQTEGIEIPAEDDETILEQFTEALEIAEEVAPDMELLLKKQLGGRQATQEMREGVL